MAEKQPRTSDEVVNDQDQETSDQEVSEALQTTETLSSEPVEEKKHLLQPSDLKNADIFAIGEHIDRVVFVTTDGKKITVGKEV